MWNRNQLIILKIELKDRFSKELNLQFEQILTNHIIINIYSSIDELNIHNIILLKDQQYLPELGKSILSESLAIKCMAYTM